MSVSFFSFFELGLKSALGSCILYYYLCAILGLRIGLSKVKTRLKLNSTRKYLQDRRLQWFGHLEKIEENA